MKIDDLSFFETNMATFDPLIWDIIFKFLSYEHQVHYRYLCKAANEIAPEFLGKSFINKFTGHIDLFSANYPENILRIFYGFGQHECTHYVTNDSIYDTYCDHHTPIIMRTTCRDNWTYHDTITNQCIYLDIHDKYDISFTTNAVGATSVVIIRLLSIRDILATFNGCYSGALYCDINRETNTVNTMIFDNGGVIYWYSIDQN